MNLGAESKENQIADVGSSDVHYHSYTNRLLGFFDILGFSSLLEKQEVQDVHKVLAKFIDDAQSKDFINDEITPQNEKRKVSNFEVTQFAFDTLILVSSDPSSVHADANFLFACIQIMQTSMKAGLALRGAIGYGDVLADLQRGMILSKEFPRLARLEKCQEWMGCCVTEQAMERLKEPLFGVNFDFNPHSAIIPWKVPMKSLENGQPQFSINWLATSPDSVWKPIIAQLIPAKKGPTECFINALMEAPGFRQMLSPPAHPVHEFRYMATRLKVHFLFLNELGSPVDPIHPFQVNMSDSDGNSRSIIFRGSSHV